MADQVRVTNTKPTLEAVEQRKTPRIKMALPIQIIGQDSPQNKWQEISRVIEVSRTGASFNLKRGVPPGLIVHLSFPMPWKLRQYRHTEPSYKIYAVVRNTTQLANREFRTGVEFIGEHPPASFHTCPWTIYASTTWRGEEHRGAIRKKVCHLVWVEYYNKQGQLLSVEQGCTENVSRTGARICVQEPPAEYERVKVFAMGQGFETYARLVKQFLGKDGLYRLGVQFLGKEWEQQE